MTWMQKDVNLWIANITEDIYRVVFIQWYSETGSFHLKDEQINLASMTEDEIESVIQGYFESVYELKRKRTDWKQVIAELYAARSKRMFVSSKRFNIVMMHVKTHYGLQNRFTHQFDTTFL